jgi:DNA-binding IclR family transcriptional regulator
LAELVASLRIPKSTFRMKRDRVPELIRSVVKVAEILSAALGYRKTRNVVAIRRIS